MLSAPGNHAHAINSVTVQQRKPYTTRDVCGIVLHFPRPLDPLLTAPAVVDVIEGGQWPGEPRSAVALFNCEIAAQSDLDELFERAIVEAVADPQAVQSSFGWGLVLLPTGRCALILVASGIPLCQSDIVNLADEFTLRYNQRHVENNHTPSNTDSSRSVAVFEPSTSSANTLEQQVAFCRDELREPFPTLVIPGRRCFRGASQTLRVSSFATVVPPKLSDALKSLGEALGAAMPTILLSAFVSVLQRYVAEEKITIASTFGRRMDSPVPDAGGFANVLLLRIGLDDDPDFLTVVKRVRAAVDVAMRHGDVCVEHVARAVAQVAPAEPPHLPRIAFDLQTKACPGLVYDALDIRHSDPRIAAEATYEVRVGCVVVRDEVTVRWQFDRDIHDREAMEGIAASFTRFLESVADDSKSPVSRISLTTPAERDARIAAGCGDRRRYERNAPIHGIWSTQVERTPHAIAIADASMQMTYAQVERRANQLAHHLISRGVGIGTTVGVVFDRSIELPITLLAILKAGGTYVPLDHDYPPERLGLMIADAAIVFIVAVDAELPSPFAGRTIHLRHDAVAIDACSIEAPNVAVPADAYAYVTYTSGSTGRPKGVAIPHRGVVRLVRGADYFEIAPTDGYLQHAPLAFDASTFEIWAPLLNGARLGIPRRGLLTMAELAQAVERFKVTTMFLTTSLFGRLVESRLEAFGRIRQLLTGGEVASPSHMREFLDRYPACRLIAVYGPTENTTFSTWHPLPTTDAIGTDVPIGRPIANSTAYVVDTRGEPVPIGVPGELWVGGDGVAGGYLGLPELSRERFVEDPFVSPNTARIYKTGDRARWRRDGVLEFLGRTDDQVKIRGFRIELGEIEAVLQAHSGVSAAAAVTVTSDGEKTICAFVEPARRNALGEAEIRAHLAAKLPRYMLPHRICIVPELPHHASGKIDRVSLARQASSPSLVARSPKQDAPPLRPLSRKHDIQQTIVDVWRTALMLDEEPALDENFFDAGGDSLRLLKVHIALSERLKRDIRVMDLFEHTTIRGLAAFLSSAQG